MMTDKQKEALYQARIRFIVLFLMPDICETFIAEANDFYHKAGFEGFTFDLKRKWKALIKAAYDLRKVTKTFPEDAAYDYGVLSDLIYTLILKAIDRCSENNSVIQLFIDYIEKFPSQRNIEFK